MPDKKSLAVTSFGPEGFKVYGKKFLRNFLEFTNLSLHVYVEEQNKKYPKDSRIEYRMLWDVPGCREFVKLAPSLELGYRFDSGKFCRKVFAQLATLDKAEEQFVYWFDADTFFVNPLDEKKMEGWLTDVAVAYMGRQGFHCCSSFVGYNKWHSHLKDYMNRLLALYVGREIYKISEGWTDCDAMAHAMLCLDVNNILKDDPRAVGTANVFDLCFPGHHLKGNRKFK